MNKCELNEAGKDVRKSANSWVASAGALTALSPSLADRQTNSPQRPRCCCQGLYGLLRSSWCFRQGRVAQLHSISRSIKVCEKVQWLAHSRKLAGTLKLTISQERHCALLGIQEHANDITAAHLLELLHDLTVDMESSYSAWRWWVILAATSIIAPTIQLPPRDQPSRLDSVCCDTAPLLVPDVMHYELKEMSATPHWLGCHDCAEVRPCIRRKLHDVAIS
mmetsp:Transcript_14870/g.26476  ORF Transcript_14870/g.26476 Transcript_14870/m.26476 type:complete len:221 (+) Transcript_14870:1-663(+)